MRHSKSPGTTQKSGQESGHRADGTAAVESAVWADGLTGLPGEGLIEEGARVQGLMAEQTEAHGLVEGSDGGGEFDPEVAGVEAAEDLGAVATATEPEEHEGGRVGLLPGAIRRVVRLFVPSARVDELRTENAILASRVRVLSRWVETSGEMLRATDAEVVRGLLSRFLREELGVATVAFLPKALSGSLLGRITLELPASGESAVADRGPTRRPPGAVGMRRTGECVELILEPGAEWGRAEHAIAERAADMTDAVLESIARLDDARRQSLTDSLTGLYNRRSLDRMLEREVLLATRHRTPMSVVAIDIDHFKQVNDSLGHAAGDDLLKHVADALTSTLRRSDLAFRPGGDEFVVLLPQTALSNALAAMEKVRKALNEAALPRSIGAAPTLSIGVAELWHGATAMELLHAADAALYAAKRDARNCTRAHRAAA